MIRKSWRHLKLRHRFNTRLWDISGLIRVVDSGFLILPWTFHLFQSLEAFCRSLSVSRQEALRVHAESALWEEEKASRSVLEHCSPALKRTLSKGSALLEAWNKARTPLECAATQHLTEEELLALAENCRLSRVSWNETQGIMAYKVDLFSVDEICLCFMNKTGDRVEVGESMLGWKALQAEMARCLPGIDPTWQEKIIQPPFAENLTRLWPLDSR